MVSWNYFADVRPSGQTPLALVARTRYPRARRQLSLGQNIAWGTGSYASPRPHRRRLDGLAAAPRRSS